jgi:hypothetical protein
MSIPGLEIGMFGQKLGDFGFDRLGQGARPIAQDLGQMVGEDPWLNQLDDVIVGHGVPRPGRHALRKDVSHRPRD